MLLTALEDQLSHLSSVCRLFFILDEADDCGVIAKLQDLHKWVMRGAVVGIEEEQ